MIVAVMCARSALFTSALEGIVLIPVCAVFVMQPTLGATLEVAFYIGGGAVFSTAAASLAVTVLPGTFPVALGVLALTILLMGLAEWPPTLKRFASGCLVINLLVWVMPRDIDTGRPSVNAFWCIRLLGSVAVGICIAVVVASIFPALASSEAQLRIRIIHETHARETELIMQEFLADSTAADNPAAKRRSDEGAALNSVNVVSSWATTAILVESTVGVASEEQRLAAAVDLHTAAAQQLKFAEVALSAAAWEPVLLRCSPCVRSLHSLCFSNRSKLDLLVVQAKARQRALHVMLTAQPLAFQHAALLRDVQRHAPFVGSRLRAPLRALTSVVARALRFCGAELEMAPTELRAPVSPGSGPSLSDQLMRAVSDVSTAVVASRRTALFRPGPEGHQAWHGAQLWSPMTLVHALLQIAEDLAALNDTESEPPSLGSCCQSFASRVFTWWKRCTSWCGQERDDRLFRQRWGFCEFCLGVFQSIGASISSPLGSAPRWYRTARLTLGVIFATLISQAAAPAIKGTATAFWAPVTVAFIAGGSESGSYRTVTQRLLGTLLGSTAGLLIAVFCAQASDETQSTSALAICLAAWSAALHMSRPGGAGSYWATVAAFTAPIVAINGGGDVDLIKAFALSRMEMTWLGICTFYVVTLVLPVSARLAALRGCISALEKLNLAAVAVTDAFCLMEAGVCITDLGGLVQANAIDAPRNVSGTSSSPDGAAAVEPTDYVTPQTQVDIALRALADVDAFLSDCPTLLDEAVYEPQLWSLPFDAIRSRYTEMRAALARGSRAVRLVHTSVSALLLSRAGDAGAQAGITRSISKDPLQKDVDQVKSSPLQAVALLSTMRRLVASVVTVHSLAARSIATIDILWWQALLPVPPSSKYGSSGSAASARAELGVAVAAMIENVSDFTACYDEFLHAYIEAQLAAAAIAPFRPPSVDCAPSFGASSAATSAAGLVNPNTHQLLPPTDALCLNSASFALRDLAAAALDLVRATRDAGLKR